MNDRVPIYVGNLHLSVSNYQLCEVFKKKKQMMWVAMVVMDPKKKDLRYELTNFKRKKRWYTNLQSRIPPILALKKL